MTTQTNTLPAPAPWLRADEGSDSEEEARLKARVATLQAVIVEKESTIGFLRDLLTAKWFDSEG